MLVCSIPESATLPAARERDKNEAGRRSSAARWAATMSEPRIGRVLVASLHQAIADLLPTRLEFYENWLNVNGLREGTIGLAPLSAVLSFLRTEGDGLRVDHRARRRIRRRLDGQHPAAVRAPGHPARCRRRCAPARRSGWRACSCAAPTRVARDRPAEERHRLDRSAGARSSARCAKRQSCLCAASMPRRSARVMHLFDLRADAQRQRVPRRRRPQGLPPVGGRQRRAPTNRPSTSLPRSLEAPVAIRMLPSTCVVSAPCARARHAGRAGSASAQGLTGRVLVVPVRERAARAHGATGCPKRRRCCSPTSCGPAASARSRGAERVRAFEQLHLPLSASLSRAT